MRSIGNPNIDTTDRSYVANKSLNSFKNHQSGGNKRKKGGRPMGIGTKRDEFEKEKQNLSEAPDIAEGLFSNTENVLLH